MENGGPKDDEGQSTDYVMDISRNKIEELVKPIAEEFVFELKKSFQKVQHTRYLFTNSFYLDC